MPRKNKTTTATAAATEPVQKKSEESGPAVRIVEAPKSVHGGIGSQALVTVVVEVGPFPKVTLKKTKFSFKPLRLDPLLRRLQALAVEHNELSSSIGGVSGSNSSVGDVDGVLASGDRLLLCRVRLPKEMTGILRIFVDNDPVIDINYIKADVAGPRMIEYIVGQVDREVRMTRSNLIRSKRGSVKKTTTFTYSRSDIDDNGTPAGYGKKTKLPTKL